MAKRNYQGTDALMIETARTIHSYYLLDAAAFAAYSSRFGPSYAADFATAIDNAESTETYDQRLSTSVIKTETVIHKMEAARKIYRRAKNYAELTFPESPGTLAAFTRGYREASKSQNAMIGFLEVLKDTLTTYQATLSLPTKGGMPATFIADVQAAYEALKGSNVDQETHIGQTEVSSEVRISALNAAYAIMMEICNTAQAIFEDSPARRSIYVYNPYTNPADTTRYTGIIEPGKTLPIATLPYRAAQFISFENTGTVALLFDIAKESLPDEPESLAGNLVDLAGGATLTHPMQWLNADLDEDMPVKILGYNPSTTTAGSYEVNVNNE